MSNYNQLNEDNSQNQSANQEQNFLNIAGNVDQVQGAEIEMEPVQKKVNARDYLPDPRIQKKQKQALSLQAQKQLAEAHNKKEIEMAMLKRIIFRIFIFFVYLAFIVLGFIAVYLYLAYIKESYTHRLPSNITLNVDNCMFSIYDDSTLGNNMRIEFNIPGSFDPWLGESSKLITSSKKDNVTKLMTYHYTVKNILTLEACQISLYVGNSSKKINNFEFNCLNDASCAFVSYSQNLTIGNMTTIKGYDIDLNVLSINTQAMEFVATSGLAQFNHFNISRDSSINLTAGNIILQSVNSYVVNWTSGVPSYCISAPQLSGLDVTGCQRVRINKYGELVVSDASDNTTTTANSTSNDTSTDNTSSDSNTTSRRLLLEKSTTSLSKSKPKINNHKKVHSLLNHLDDDTTSDSDTDADADADTDDSDTADTNSTNSTSTDDDEDEEVDEPLPDSCWGRIGLCSSNESSCDGSNSSSLPTLYVATGTGAIYANIIPEVGKPAAEDNANLKSVLFEDGSVGWSVSTLLDLTDDYDDSNSDTVFDPVFLVKIGSKTSNSSLFQQWVISYAPAYAYVRPWWIGTYSLTLLSTSSYEIEADLNPGFCPHTPGLTQTKLYAVQSMISETFLNESSGVFSFTYPSDIDLPTIDVDYNATNYGFRNVPETIGDEYWISISKDNSSYYEYVYEDLSQSSTIEAAVILSAVIAILVGIYLVVGAVYGINAIYIDIIDIVTSTSKYSKIEHKDDPNAYQPLMSTDKGKKLQAQLPKPEEVPTMSYNPIQLFRQLFVLAPPMSAFVDFLCVYMSKKYINSAEVFFSLIFVERQNEDNDDELHHLEKERISGTEMKTLYEKFCYLNGYLEQKLDDDNISNLMNSTYGFKIVTKNDSQTLYYTKVMLLNDEIPKIGKDKDRGGQSSMTLFIKMCCKTSKFDSDSVQVTDFTSQYEQFCMINYLKVETPTLSEMSTNYSIGNSFLDQQWIVRTTSDTKTDTAGTGDAAAGAGDAAGAGNAAAGAGNAAAIKTQATGFFAKLKDKLSGSMTKKIYYINRKRLNNHFYLLMQLPEKIETPTELTEANKELILFPGWLIVDIFTVLFHIITILVLMVPVLGFFLLENVLYSDYSLSPDKDLITIEDLSNNIWGLPTKLYTSSLWIQILILVVLIFWSLGFIDLLYYYMKMEFPQEKFFRKTRASEAHFVQILFRRLMWVLVLISLWALGSYISLAMVWMILGAVINPTAFLPYAAGASTFITVVTTKYNEFMNLAENGLKKVIEYIQSLTQKELNGMLKKMGLSGSSISTITGSLSSATVSTDTVKAVTAQAVALGLADAAEVDPSSASDPVAYVKDLKEKMQSKAEDYMKEKMAKIIKKEDAWIQDYFMRVVISILKQDKNKLKTDLHDLLANLNGRVSGPDSKAFAMPEVLISLLQEFTFISDTNMSSEDFMLMIIDPIANFFMELLQQKNWNAYYEINKDAITKMIYMINSLEKNDTSSVVTHLTSMIDKVDYFKELKQHKKLFNIAVKLFDGNKLNYHQVFKMLNDFIKDMKVEQEIVDFFDLLLNAFNHQSETPSIRDMNLTVERFVRKTMFISEEDRHKQDKYKQFKENVRLIAYNLTMFFAFIYNEFDGMPKEILTNIITLMKNELPSYFPDEKFYKNLTPILQASFETVGCFLEEPTAVIKQLENNASAFGVSNYAARQIKIFSTMKYKEMYPGKEIYQVQNLKLWKDIYTNLSFNKKILMGLFGFITLRFDDIKEINDLVSFMLTLGKVDSDQRSKTLDIFKLYGSDSESDISTSATNLGIPRQFVPLILIAKKILDPKFVSDLDWIELGLDDDKLLDARYTIFYDEKKFDKWREDVAAKLSKVNEKIMEGNDDGPAKKTLLLLSCKGPIAKQTIKNDLDTLSTNKNKIAQFTEYQFELLTRMINSRAINKASTSSFDSDSKTGIVDLAKAINLEETKLEKILSLWFLTKADKVLSVIKEFSPDFIEAGCEENYETYISYVYTKMENLAKKEEFAKVEFNKNFRLNIPSTILNKSLFNPNASLDLNSMYEMISYPLNHLIQTDQNGQPYYRDYDECLISLAPLVKYLNSHMDVQHIMLVRKIFNIDHEGIADLLMILNETSQTNSLSLFLDHIDKYCPESMKFFIALLAFFQGKATNVEITNSTFEKVSIRTYLSDFVYPELLDAMYAIFMKEAHEYSEYLLKFFRRIEACKQKDAGSISLQGLVKIPPTIIENFLKLCSGDDYSAQVISKELGLSSEAIEFGSGLTRIMNCKVEVKSETITLVCGNTDFKSALIKIGVKSNECLTLLKILYGCYDNDDIKWMIEALNLDKEKIGNDDSLIKSLLALDQVLDEFETPDKNFTTLKKRIDIAQPLLDMMNVDRDLVLLASTLAHGDFSILMKLNDIPSFNFLTPKNTDAHPEYLEFLMGLCGTISHRSENISINSLFRKYYKNLQKGIQSTDPDYMNPTSSRSYAVFCLYKSLDISPIWTFLYLGDINVWDYVWELYYDNKNYKDPFLNPLIILMIVLNYIETPTPFKEILFDNQYIDNYCKFLDSESFKDITLPNPLPGKKEPIKLDHNSQTIQESWKGYKTTAKGINELLWANWAKTKDKLEDLAKKNSYSNEILDFWPDKERNFTDAQITEALKQAALSSIRKKSSSIEQKDIDNFCVLALKSPLSLEEFLESYDDSSVKEKIIPLLENIFPDIITNVINTVTDILEDPRDNDADEDEIIATNKKKPKDPYAIPRIECYFEDKNGNEFIMCALSLMVELRNAFFGIQDFDDRGEDHYKLFTYKLDVLMTMIEKNSFHKNFMNSFSKYRVMQIVGLAAGFCVKGEHMIRGNVTHQYNDMEFQIEFNKTIEIYKKNPKKMNFYMMIEKLRKIWSIVKDFKDARNNRFFRIYNLNVLENAVENENYYEINNEPENVIYSSYPGSKFFKWLPLLYDVPTCNLLIDFNEEDFYFDPNKPSESRLGIIQKYLKNDRVDKYDLRSGAEWKDVVKYQDTWNTIFDSDEYLQLVSIFRGYYNSISESNTFFTIRYGDQVPYLYGLLGLNASASNINENNVSACESYIAACGSGLTSNRKSLIEIIKFLYGNAETIKKFSSSFSDNDQIFEKFMKLSASTIRHIPEIASAEFLISKIQGLSSIEIEVFKKILDVSIGSTSYLDELIEYSKDKKNLNENAAAAFSNLINNLDIYSLRTESNLNLETFNLKDKTSYSINIQKNSSAFYLELFKIAIFQFPENVSPNVTLLNIPNCDMFGEQGDIEDRTDDQKENIKNKARLTLLFSICNNILDGDFSIFFMLNSSDFYDILKILNLANNENDLKTLRVIASLKPNKLNPKLVKNRPENLDIESRAKEFKEMKIIDLPAKVENKEELEGKLSSLILGMQYWNIVELLKGLETTDDESENAEFYCLMQSFYVWKNMSPILANWNSLNSPDSKVQIDSKVIGTSIKVFLGKILQTIRKTNQAKKYKKAIKSPTKPGANKNQLEDSKIADDQNYKNIQKELRQPQNKLSHAFVNQINQYKIKGHTSHYLDWMLNLSAIFSKNGPQDPITKSEAFFTGRYLKKLTNDESLKFVLNFSLTSYSILFEKKKAKKSSKADKKPEESTQLNVGPMSLVQSLPTCINLLNPTKYGAVVTEERRNHLMIFDLFMRLCVVLQKKGKSNKPTEEMLVASLGVFKLVLSKLNLDQKSGQLTLFYDIINLLTGYDISESKISSKKTPNLIEKLYNVLDKAFLDKPNVKPYLNRKVLGELNKHLTKLADFNIKTLTDPKFQSVLIEFLCAISGTDRDEALKAKAAAAATKKGGIAAGKKTKAIEEKKDKDKDKDKDKSKVEEADIPQNQLLEIQISDIDAIIKLTQLDLPSLEVLIGKLESDPQKLKLFSKMHDDIKKNYNVYGKSASVEDTSGGAVSNKAKAGDNEIEEILKKIQNGTATTHEVFVATDREGDSSGSISKQEFSALARRLNINLTDHRVNEIFASLKKAGGSKSDEDLDEEEFAKALQYLNQKSTNMTLEALGISKSMLIVALVSLIIILLLLFVFIFLGIQGFAVGSSFGSVINSLLPMGAGAGVGGGKDEDKEKKTSSETVGNAVNKSKTILQTNSV